MKKKSKVSDYKLKQMLKQYTPKQIIYKHINSDITLMARQITMLIKKKELQK